MACRPRAARMPESAEEDGYSTTDIKKANETSKIITYIKDCYAYAGGAHGYVLP